VSLKITVAAPFRNMRKEQLRKNEFIFFLAIDRKWMNKEQAGRLLEIAEAEGLIVQKGGNVVPAFDVAGVQIPLGFKPSSEIFERRDALSELLERIAAARDVPLSEVAAELHAVIEERFDGNLLPEAAAVIIAAEHNVPYEDKIDDLRRSVLKKS
jgi:hypothetical protein